MAAAEGADTLGASDFPQAVAGALDAPGRGGRRVRVPPWPSPPRSAGWRSPGSVVRVHPPLVTALSVVPSLGAHGCWSASHPHRRGHVAGHVVRRPCPTVAGSDHHAWRAGRPRSSSTLRGGRAPGVHDLPARPGSSTPSRRRGGGAEAELDSMNLAAPLIDGERMYVPAGRDGPRRCRAAVAVEVVPGPIDLNTATVGQLEELPGVGPATAAAIVAHRAITGPFASVDELDRCTAASGRPSSRRSAPGHGVTVRGVRAIASEQRLAEHRWPRSTLQRRRPRRRRTATRIRQKSRHVAIGERVAGATREPDQHRQRSARDTASGYWLSSANGAPTTRRPGAATTPPNRPIAPLKRVSPSRRANDAMAPTTAGGISATNEPRHGSASDTTVGRRATGGRGR